MARSVQRPCATCPTRRGGRGLDRVREMLFEDDDVLMLVNPSLDGIENDIDGTHFTHATGSNRSGPHRPTAESCAAFATIWSPVRLTPTSRRTPTRSRRWPVVRASVLAGVALPSTGTSIVPIDRGGASGRGPASAPAGTRQPQGGAEGEPPREEPGIPQVGMPRQRSTVSTRTSSDDVGLDQEPGNGQHAAVGNQRRRRDPAEDARHPPARPCGQPSWPARDDRSGQRDDRLHRDDRPERDDDRRAPLSSPSLDVAPDGVQQTCSAHSPVRAHRCVAQPERPGTGRRDADKMGPGRHGTGVSLRSSVTRTREAGPDSSRAGGRRPRPGRVTPVAQPLAAAGTHVKHRTGGPRLVVNRSQRERLASP